MTRTISLITATVGAALLFALPAYGDNWGADKAQPATSNVRVSPDLEDRAIAAQQDELSAMLDAREQAFGAGLGTENLSALDARERSFATKQVVTPTPDWFERAAAAAIRDNRGVFVADDRFDLHPQTVPQTVTATSSGRDVDVAQIGIGLGIGLLLALGLYLAMKYTRIRPVAH
jgi:hypothetical protein